ncbi:MAG: AMP-binding protein [Myxococcota bacterium]
MSWPELLAQAESVASALQRAGMHPGDPILLVSDRSADFLAGLWGAFLAGVVPVPLPSAPRWEAWGGAAQRLLGVFELLDGPPIMLGGDTARALQDSRAALGLSDARLWPIATLSAAPGAYAPPPLAPDAPAIFLLTSGSTGRPKAVTHVQSTVIAMLHAYGERHAFGPDEVFLNWLGLDHVAPLFMVHLSAVWHAAAHVNAPAARFSADPALALDWASRFGATSTFVANFAFGLMADAAADAPPGRWDLSRFRVLANGGETIVARTARRFVATLMPHGLPAHAMVPIWGMSETGSATITALDFTLETIDDADQFVPIGDPVAGFGMRVVDPSGALVSEGEIGHLHVRGAQLHRGYHRRPDADRESFTDDGWFDTGDLAFIDARGMHIAGRAKDLIIISGVNIYAHDVEAAVESLPGIAPSFVAACPVRPAGADTDGLAIFFSPEDPDEAGLADLCAQVRGAVSRAAGVGVSYLLPVGRSAIPKTEIGKIQRAILRRRLESGEFDALHRRVEALCHGRRTTPDWFFEPVWRPRPVTPALEGPTGLLVLGGPSAPSVQDGACAVRWVNDSGALSGPESFDADALTGAARDFFASAGPRPAVVLRARRGPAPSSPDALHAEALRRSATLVALAAALDLTATPSVRLLVETCRAIRVREGEGGSVAEAPLLGLLASLRHEQPGHAFIHLDHDADSPDADWRIVESELAADPRGELEVAHRGGSRLVRRLRRVAFGAEPAAPRPADAPAPTRWLLTGGLGGVGQVLALRLLERPDTRLLIVGRRAESELPSEAAAALASLRGTGATARDVSYVALDIAEPGALAAAVAQQETAWGAPLQAVAHLAALMGSCLVARTGEADLRASLRPRLLGTLAAAALLDERPDAAFFDHTSVNGLFGGFGAGAYAAGCRVGEAVVATLRARGRRASSVAWSLWEDRGVTQGLPVESLAQRRGYTPIDARRGADAMSVAMRYAPASWLVGLDPRALPIRRLLDAGPVTPAPPAGVASPTATGHPAVGRGGGASDLTQRRLAAIWRDLLGVQHLGIDDTFFDLGGHSLLLAKLQARVEADFGRTTPLMVLFEQPTIRKQAAWLEAGGDTDPTAPSPPPDDQALARAVQRRQALGRPRPGRRS